MAKGDKTVQVSQYDHHQVSHAAEKRDITIKQWIAEAIAAKLTKEE